MDFNKEYAAHQHALMHADHAACNNRRKTHLARASSIAKRISAFQRLNATDITSPAKVGVSILLSLKFDGYRRIGFERKMPFSAYKTTTSFQLTT